ncbi:hypothetical protein [Curtobacterium sp. RRHDQ10]|uniref:hypothetical protein n=1 Tax=Curtobacterium phyllosphaerae TaxID=3413379 RepID=UPI003BF19782
MTPNRRLRLEGRRAFATRLPSVMGRRRHAVLTIAALTVGAAVALVTGIGVGAQDDDRAGIVGVVAVALGAAAGSFAAYVAARVFLVRDLRTLPEPPWRHDGVLERAADPDGPGLAPSDLGPLRVAIDRAEVRAVWGVLIGWAQCGVGAGVVVASVLTFPATPWIIALTAFLVGGLGQDGAFRAYRLLGRATVAARAVAAHTADTATSTVPTTDGAATGGAAVDGAAPGDPVSGDPAPGPRRRTSRRMPPRPPGRGSALELPDE